MNKVIGRTIQQLLDSPYISQQNREILLLQKRRLEEQTMNAGDVQQVKDIAYLMTGRTSGIDRDNSTNKLSNNEKYWIYISQSEAQAHPLYGIRGWALALWASIVLGIVNNISGFFIVGMNVLFLSRELLYNNSEDLVTIMEIDRVLCLFKAGMLSLSLYYFSRKKSAFYKCFLFISTTHILWEFIKVFNLVYRSGSIPYYFVNNYNEYVARSILLAAISSSVTLAWTAYVVRSHRMNVTVRRQVRPNDPLIRNRHAKSDMSHQQENITEIGDIAGDLGKNINRGAFAESSMQIQTQSDATARLRRLSRLREEGLITEQEFQSLRQNILKNL